MQVYEGRHRALPPHGCPGPYAQRVSDYGTRRRAPLIAAGALAAVLVVCAAGGFLFFRPYLSDQYPASLTTPPEIAGLTLSTNPQLEEAAAQMAATMSGELNLSGPIAAVYLEPDGDERAVAVWGGTAMLRDPEAQLDEAFREAEAGGFPIADLRQVEPGPPGGVAKCAHGAIDNLPMSICGWADHGSLVMAVFFSREVDESAGLLRTLRAGLRSG